MTESEIISHSIHGNSRELAAEVRRLTRLSTTCCSCGQHCGTLAALQDHCRTCEKHPVAVANAEVQRLQDAIRRHRDYRGDDRCHMDDSELYAVLPEGDTRPTRETEVTIENCKRYIACRQQGREYVSPQRRIEELESFVAELTAKYATQSAALTRAAEIHAEKQREIDRLRDLLRQAAEAMPNRNYLATKIREVMG